MKIGDSMKSLGTKKLETKRLILRRFTIDDAEAMYNNCATDPETCKYLSWDVHSSLDVTKEYINNVISKYENKDYYGWVVEIKETHEIIGTISSVITNTKHSTVEIGYSYGSKYWGKGYATEALRRVIEFFINDCETYIVTASHISGNPASGRVMEKAGMTKDAVVRSRRINKFTKERNDAVLYSIIKEEL